MQLRRTLTALALTLLVPTAMLACDLDVSDETYGETGVLDTTADAPDQHALLHANSGYVSRDGPRAPVAASPLPPARIAPEHVPVAAVPLERDINPEHVDLAAIAIVHTEIQLLTAQLAAKPGVADKGKSRPPKPTTKPPIKDDAAEPTAQPDDCDQENAWKCDPPTDTSLYWGPNGRHLAAVLVETERGGTGHQDISATITRLRDRSVRFARTISDASDYEDAEDNGDDEAAKAERRGMKFLRKLGRARYTPAESLKLERPPTDDDDDAEDDSYPTPHGTVYGGPLDGIQIQAYSWRGSDRVRIRVTPKNGKRYQLGSAPATLDHCVDRDWGDGRVRRGDQWCRSLTKHVSGAWLSPNGKYLVVQVDTMGVSCMDDINSVLVIGRLR